MIASEKIGITPKQMHLKNSIKIFIEKNGFSPSFKELAKIQGCQVSNIQRMMNDLQRRGHITRKYGVPRSVQIVPDEV